MIDLSEYINKIEESKKLDENSSLEDIEKAMETVQTVSHDMNNLQLGVKLFINSVYGATASPFFIGYNLNVAQAITAQGQKTTQYASKSMEEYFQKLWPIDKKAHKALGIKKPGKVMEAVTRYGDTDSLAFDSIVNSNHGKMTIEELFEKSVNNASDFSITPQGNEILVPSGLTVENYTEDGQVKQCDVRYLIRHKINKPKYRIRTKSGKEIIVTNDHSCIVFRDGEKLVVKASEILKTDKILSIKYRKN